MKYVLLEPDKRFPTINNYNEDIFEIMTYIAKTPSSKQFVVFNKNSKSTNFIKKSYKKDYEKENIDIDSVSSLSSQEGFGFGTNIDQMIDIESCDNLSKIIDKTLESQKFDKQYSQYLSSDNKVNSNLNINSILINNDPKHILSKPITNMDMKETIPILEENKHLCALNDKFHEKVGVNISLNHQNDPCNLQIRRETKALKTKSTTKSFSQIR